MASGSAATVTKIERAHQMYRDGKYTDALEYYTDALSVAKTNPQKIALHSNRAACYLKLHRFHQAAEECTSVLELDHNHTGALMLRAQTLVTLKEYHSALFDVNRLIDLDSASEVYRNLQTRLRTQLALAPIPEDEAEFEQCDDSMDEMDLDETEEAQDDVERGEWGNEEVDTSDSAKVNSVKSKPESISPTAEVASPRNQTSQKLADQQPLGWNTIPKPKGHSHLDYSRWDSVEDDSSEDDDSSDDDEDSQPQYRFRVKTVGVKAVK